MNSLNPIFNESKIRLTSNQPIKKNVSKKNRKTRSDRCRDIKFPVTDDEKAAVRFMATRYKDPASPNKKLSPTKMATKMLIDGLQNPWKVDHNISYKDTKQYVHTKPTEYWYEQVVRLSIEWGISERRAVHRIVISLLNKGGFHV